MKKQIKKNAFESAKEWFAKYKFIKLQISALEKYKNYPIILISIVLLKSQVIEFEIKQLINTLDLHLDFSNNSTILKRKVRKPCDFQKCSLGDLIKILEEYDSQIIYGLVGKLLPFNTIRIELVHYLLESDTNIDDIIKKSNEGLVCANEIFTKINEIEEYFRENDPLRLEGIKI